ncbi:MAG: sigma-70 family RNA polymerase sigma factor [Bryobacteraceae bacterium]|nr:sigma-70 family RNA polymerase sigma factor [Bryobacteraceae bacterium]
MAMQRAPEVTEAELARRLLAGDDGAFDSFVDHFQKRVFQYVYLMCGSREDAEEVAQETLLKVFQNLDQLREPERVKPWVFRIAKNACLMKRRRSIFAPPRELPLQDAAHEVVDRSPAPEERILQSEMSALVHRALAALPDLYRSVILLREFEELSTAEAAEVLDVSEDVVKTRLHRGRLALRHALDALLQAPAPVR